MASLFSSLLSRLWALEYNYIPKKLQLHSSKTEFSGGTNAESNEETPLSIGRNVDQPVKISDVAQDIAERVSAKTMAAYADLKDSINNNRLPDGDGDGVSDENTNAGSSKSEKFADKSSESKRDVVNVRVTTDEGAESKGLPETSPLSTGRDVEQKMKVADVAQDIADRVGAKTKTAYADVTDKISKLTQPTPGSPTSTRREALPGSPTPVPEARVVDVLFPAPAARTPQSTSKVPPETSKVPPSTSKVPQTTSKVPPAAISSDSDSDDLFKSATKASQSGKTQTVVKMPNTQAIGDALKTTVNKISTLFDSDSDEDDIFKVIVFNFRLFSCLYEARWANVPQQLCLPRRSKAPIALALTKSVFLAMEGGGVEQKNNDPLVCTFLPVRLWYICQLSGSFTSV